MIINKKYDDLPNLDLKKMFRIQWHLTERCNLNCIHCYQDELCNTNELDLNEMKKAADMLKKTMIKWDMECEVSLTGGEPFVRKDWFEFAQYLESLGFYVSILTNGTLINNTTITQLKKLDKLRYVQISLDGGTEKVHEQVRGKGTFEKSLNSIKLLSQNGIKVATKFTIHKLNMSDLVPYLELTEKIGVKFVSVARYIPWGQGENIKEYFLSDKETKDVYETVLKYAKKNVGKIFYDTRRPLWILLSDEKTKVGGRCVAAINGLTIMPNGDILPCRPMGVVIGNVTENTFFEVWYTSDLLWKIRNYKDWECGRCEHNKLCGGCLAISNGVYGDFFKNDPQCFKDMVDK